MTLNFSDVSAATVAKTSLKWSRIQFKNCC